MNQPRPPHRIVIITPDIHGPIRNGGIGTAFAALAQKMAAWGLDVTVAYALGLYSETKPVDHWRAYYRARHVHFLPLDKKAFDADGTLTINAPRLRQLAWLIYRWLERHQDDYDLAIFPEWMGLAYYALLAKGQGLAFGALTLAVNAHSPEIWAMEGNHLLPAEPDCLDRDFMERESIRRADWVISPSLYMLDWMRTHQWQIAPRQLVIQNLMLDQEVGPPHNTTTTPPPATDLVFFGRLEFRKGLKLFCDAIERLSPEAKQRIRSIQFLGKAVIHADGFSSLSYLKKRLQDWSIPTTISTNKDKDQALAELSRPGVVAVMASLVENSPYTVLECLHHGIQFIASNVGGIPELIAAEDKADCLFAPTPSSLAKQIDRVFLHGARPARMATSQAQTAQQWQDWLTALTPAPPAPAAPAAPPLVSVCLVHYNRPHYLARALDSLRQQNYPNLEIVLVDDGSSSAEAIAFLDQLLPEFEARGWQLIRQENAYLGAARNRAVAAAHGDYLLFMDDDNIALPHELEIFITAALHSQADILTCISSLFTDTPTDTQPQIWLPLGGAAGAGLYRNVFGDANALWKRQVFLKTGGYSTDYGVGHEDWELFAKAILVGARLELVPQALFKYRVSANGMLRRGNLWIDHARSARAYLQEDPHGLGVACAYAVHLQKSRELNGMGFEASTLRISNLRVLLKALQLSRDPVLRMQFMAAWRNNGLKFAISRALGRSKALSY